MYDFLKSNQWVGKKVCFLGDSITDGIGVHKGVRYFDLLDDMIGIRSVGYGVNGAQFIGLLSQIDRMEADHGKNVDAIFVFAGTNDYNSSVPLGDWYEYSDAEVITERGADGSTAKSDIRKKREFSFDRNTFKGRINTIMARLRHDYPHKTIVLMTPIHRGYADFGPTNIQYPENYPNKLGLYIDDYVGAVKEAASIWAVELIDLHSVGRLFPCFDESADDFANFSRDRLHPGIKGHEKLARVIARKMIGIDV